MTKSRVRENVETADHGRPRKVGEALNAVGAAISAGVGGALLGTAFAGPIGAAIGAAVGAIVGGIFLRPAHPHHSG